MSLRFRPLHPRYGVEIQGVDIREPIAPAVFAEIRRALDEHALLLFRDQPVSDEEQVAFSRLFGPLETTLSANPAAGTLFQRQSNLDIATGETIPPEDRRMIYQKANYLWHTDSSFKAVPSLCSVLSARICPPEGGNTEFCDMRLGWEALPDELKAEVESGLVAEHSLTWSRDQIDPNVLTPQQRAEFPFVRQAMVRTNPVTGRKALFIGAHCSHVVGWPLEKGRAFIARLSDAAIRPEFVYSHPWREGDTIVWDNRQVLHRATAYDSVRHKRLMQRNTIAGDAPTAAQAAAA